MNSQSSAEDHESVYNVKFTTTLGFTLTMGYSRYKDPAGTTHAWICFGDKCSSHWQKELGVDLLLNLVGYRCMYDCRSHVGPSCQPGSAWPPAQLLCPVMEKEKKRKEKKENKKEKKMEDKQSGEQQHRSRTKPPAAAPASSHSTKRKTPAVGGDAQEAAASSRPRTKSTTPAVGREARGSMG